jgi:hypothetical protein
MAKWVCLRDEYDSAIYINLDAARSVLRRKNDKFTTIAFPGSEGNFVTVREMPGDIMKLGASSEP